METSFTFLDRILKHRFVSHTIFWIGILVLQSQIFLYSGRPFLDSFVITLTMLPAILLAAYSLNYYQIPKLALKRRYISFAISLILTVYFYTGLARILNLYIAEPILGLEQERPPWDFIWFIYKDIMRLAQNYLVSVYLAAIIMAVIKLIRQREQEKVRIERLEKEKKTTELNFLKAQIHPHFLLNTLNNIYALSIKKSEKTPDSVLKLSDMLKYVLYKGNEKFVSLKNEIELLENYIALEKLRYDEHLIVDFKQEVENPESIKIAPLVLMSLVENSFKHGASGDVENPTIKMSLKASKTQIIFSIFNTKNQIKQTDKSQYTKGIGSKNIKKQLELIYPNQHIFEVIEEHKSYSVTLIITLDPIENEH